jgi:hypothetical protein
MRVFPMFNTTTTGLSIAPPTIAHFRWGWDSNPWVPLMLHYLLQPHRKNLPMFSLRPTKPPDSLRIQHIHQQVHEILQKANAKYKQCHDQHRVPHQFQVGDKVWLHLQKEHLTGPHRKLHPLRYGPYTITKVVGSNAFELNTPPFLGLHPVFNVDLLRPYFPPLLDTSEIAEQLTPTELNPDCMEHASTDQIVDTQVKGTRQQRIQLYRVVKAGQLLHQGKWLTRGQIQQKFPHLMGALNAMETISS